MFCILLFTRPSSTPQVELYFLNKMLRVGGVFVLDDMVGPARDAVHTAAHFLERHAPLRDTTTERRARMPSGGSLADLRGVSMHEGPCTRGLERRSEVSGC